MPELNQLLSALFLVALVLYLMPAVLRLGSSAERRRWFQRAATAMIGIAMANCGGGDRKMVHSLTPEHLALGNGAILDGLNQARVIVSPAGSVLI